MSWFKLKLPFVIFGLCTILYAGCDYYEPIRPADLKSPFPPMPAPQIDGFQTFELDQGIVLEVSNYDYKNGCDSYLFHRYNYVEESTDFAQTIHILGSGGNPEEFRDEISITIPYDVNDFQFEVYHARLVIYRYDLFYNYVIDFDDFEQLPACVENRENHTVTVKTNKLRGRYVVGRAR